MNELQKYLVKAISILGIAVLLLVGTSAGSIYVYKQRLARQQAVASATAAIELEKITAGAKEHQGKADALAAQQPQAAAVSKVANTKAEASQKALQAALAQESPKDTTAKVEQLQGQLDASTVALADEREAHEADRKQLVLVQAENRELRLTNTDLNKALLLQAKNYSDLAVKYEESEAGRKRWKGLTIGVSLVATGSLVRSLIINR